MLIVFFFLLYFSLFFSHSSKELSFFFFFFLFSNSLSRLQNKRLGWAERKREGKANSSKAEQCKGSLRRSYSREGIKRLE